MSITLQARQLFEGDILLYEGKGLLSDIIRFFDGTPVSHASLYIGNGNVVEAIDTGVEERDILTSISDTKIIVKRLTNRPLDMAPVLRIVDNYKGKRYAYEQLIMLALILSVNKIRLNFFVAQLIKKILELASSVILKFTGGNKQALICSELVYRCYNEALPYKDDIYTIILNKPIAFNKALSHNIAFHEVNPVVKDSLISMFYGINSSNTRLFTSFPNAFQNQDINKITSSISQIDVDEQEIKELFDNVVNSYKQEDYAINEADLISLKDSLDRFLCSTINAFPSNYGFTTLNNMNDVVKTFLGVNEDFVTPGDLYKATNLITIGTIN